MSVQIPAELLLKVDFNDALLTKDVIASYYIFVVQHEKKLPYGRLQRSSEPIPVMGDCYRDSRDRLDFRGWLTVSSDFESFGFVRMVWRAPRVLRKKFRTHDIYS